MVKDTLKAHLSLGNENNIRSEVEKTSKSFRRSIYFVKDINKGETITYKHIKRIRPGFGLSPRFLSKVIGKRLKKDVLKGDRVTAELVGLNIDQDNQNT